MTMVAVMVMTTVLISRAYRSADAADRPPRLGKYMWIML